MLFLDEPTTGLDLQTRLVIWNLLQKLQKEQGLTIFLTTHYLEEAENADQIYILENGSVLAKGSVSDIKAKYAPNKLIMTMKDNKSLLHSKTLKDNKFELDALDSSQAIDFLTKNKNQIVDFEYHKGSINDTFIKITGKELQ